MRVTINELITAI